MAGMAPLFPLNPSMACCRTRLALEQCAAPVGLVTQRGTRHTPVWWHGTGLLEDVGPFHPSAGTTWTEPVQPLPVLRRAAATGAASGVSNLPRSGQQADQKEGFE